MYGVLAGGGLQSPFGRLPGEADLAGDLGHLGRSEVIEQQHSTLLVVQLGEGLERGLGRGVETLVAMPDACGVSALRAGPGVAQDPCLGVGLPAELAPVVPGGDEGFPDGSARSGEVAGQGKRLQ
jgi:hypothetical protein